MEEELLAPGPEERHTDVRIGRTILSLREGDVTEADVDAIVSPEVDDSNRHRGVAHLIRERAGLALEREYGDLGALRAGEARVTRGGKLRTRHIIHVRVPAEGAPAVAAATHLILRTARERGFTSLAIPDFGLATATGREATVQAFLAAVVAFLSTEQTPLRRLEICLYGADTLQLFRSCLQHIREQIEVAKS